MNKLFISLFTVVFMITSCAKRVPVDTSMPAISNLNDQYSPPPPSVGTGSLSAIIVGGTTPISFNSSYGNALDLSSTIEIDGENSDGSEIVLTLPVNFVVGATYSVSMTNVSINYYRNSTLLSAEKFYTCSSGSITITNDYSYAVKGFFSAKVVNSSCNYLLIEKGEFLAYR